MGNGREGEKEGDMTNIFVFILLDRVFRMLFIIFWSCYGFVSRCLICIWLVEHIDRQLVSI